MAHRFTRAPLTAVLAALLAAAPLGAQWQGVVTFHNQQSIDDRPMTNDFQYFQGPSGIAKMVVQDQRNSVSIIYNKTQNTATMVMPSQQTYMTMSLTQAQAEAQKQMSKMKITPTGKSDVVAGHKCDIYHAVDPDEGTESDACIATDMGNFATFDPPGNGHAAGGSGALSMLQQLFSAKGGFFPLKVTTTKDGKVQDTMVATSIQAKSIPASEFIPPAGYKQMTMPTMPSH